MIYYKTLEEKKTNFISRVTNTYCIYQNIDDFNDLMTLIESYQNSTDFIFRGSKEAKYKILSQLQLQWLQSNIKQDLQLYNEYVNHCVNAIKQTKSFVNNCKLNQICIDQADFYALAIMQHYGMPTPLIDFTEDINVGLFFMIDNLILSNHYSNDIDNYSSLYVIDRRHHYIVSYNDLMEKGEASADKMLEEHFDSHPEDKNLIIKRENPYTYDKVSKNGTGLILDRGFFQTNSSFFGSIKFGGTSPRQNIQEGVFALNTILRQSLEEYYYGWFKTYPLIKCYNINKKLTNDIRKYLDKQQINKDNIYQRDMIGSEIYNAMIQESRMLTLEQYIRQKYTSKK